MAASRRSGLPAHDISEAERQLDGGNQGGPVKAGLMRLHGEVCDLPPGGRGEDRMMSASKARTKSKRALQDDREIMEDEIDGARSRSWRMQVKRDKKLTELLRPDRPHRQRKRPRATRRKC